MALKIYINHTANNNPLTTLADYTEINLASDFFVFSNGSDVVADGEAIPSEASLNQAGVVIGTVDTVVPHYFLADFSDNLLREIHNAGSQNLRYVFAVDFDAATATEPTLELWDDDGMDSILIDCLGAGDPTESWFEGICTTAAAPGSTSWVGSKLAGASSTHYLSLNAGLGALTVAKTLYFQLRITVPANFTSAGKGTPIFAIKYAEN
jgi:hypothetical protein